MVLFPLSQTNNNGILERKPYYTKFGLDMHLQIVYSFLCHYEEGERIVKLNQVKAPFGKAMVILANTEGSLDQTCIPPKAKLRQPV